MLFINTTIRVKSITEVASPLPRPAGLLRAGQRKGMPMTRDDSFCYRFRVRYGECDAQKVVFNSRYGDYTDIAVVEFLRHVDLFNFLIGDFDYQLVRQVTEWKSPARFDDVLEARVRTERIGRTSFTLAVEFYQRQDHNLVATVETVYVLVHAGDLSKAEVPDDARLKLERGGPGGLTDHSRV